MNDYNEKQVREKLGKQLIALYHSYDKAKDDEHIDFDMDIITKVFEHKARFRQDKLYETYREIIGNFTKYRTMNAAVYISAFEELTR